MDRHQAPVVALDLVTIGQFDVGPERGVLEAFAGRTDRSPGGVSVGAAKGVGRSTEGPGKLRYAGHMVEVAMGYQNGAGAGPHGIERGDDRAAVAGVVGAGIDYRDFAIADQIGVRALEGERARIVCHDAAHAGPNLGRDTVNKIHLPAEWQVRCRGGIRH